MRSARLAATAAAIVVLTGVLYVAAVAADSGGQQEWKAPARAARRKNPVPTTPQAVASGQAAYTKECLSCHGDAGKGDGPAAADLERPPGDLSSAKVQQQTDGELFWKITEGRKPMPSFDAKLSEQQRWEVVDFVRTLAAKPKP